MRFRPLPFALGVVGLALAVYGVASLTGGWLGTPPWWNLSRDIRRERAEDYERWLQRWGPRSEGLDYGESDDDPDLFDNREFFVHVSHVSLPPRWHRWHRVPSRHRQAIGRAVTALGLALVAFAAWPRRAKAGAALPQRNDRDGDAEDEEGG